MSILITLSAFLAKCLLNEAYSLSRSSVLAPAAGAEAAAPGQGEAGEAQVCPGAARQPRERSLRPPGHTGTALPPDPGHRHWGLKCGQLVGVLLNVFF